MMFLTPFSPAAHAAPPLVLLLPVPIAPAVAETMTPPGVAEAPTAADDADATEPHLPAISTAAALERRVLLDGYQPGFPPHLPEQARRIDLNAVRRMRCPACHCRKMTAAPFHKMTPPAGYRIVAACEICGAGEVM